jgi:hypothetical protein
MLIQLVADNQELWALGFEPNGRLSQCSGRLVGNPSLTKDSAIYDGLEITLWGGLAHSLRIGSLYMLWCPRSF